MVLVNPALHPESGSGETESQTQFPHLLPVWFREGVRGPKVYLVGSESAQGLERSGIDGGEEDQMLLKQVCGIVAAKVIGDGPGEVPLVRPAVFSAVTDPVGPLEDLQIVGGVAIVVQEPLDEGRKVLESDGRGSGQGVRHYALSPLRSAPGTWLAGGNPGPFRWWADRNPLCGR